MSSRHKTWLLVVLLVSVTLLFFVHLPEGGFQARNGPTTPLGPSKLALLVALALLLFSHVVAALHRIAEPAWVHLVTAKVLPEAAGLFRIPLRC
jgi:hypothetical protein